MLVASHFAGAHLLTHALTWLVIGVADRRPFNEEKSMKTAIIALAVLGLSGAAYAQNQTPTGGPSNGPAGTGYQGTGSAALPSSTTGTPSATALDGPNATAETAATRAQLESAGFSDVKGLSRTPDGVWTARAVKHGVEVAVSIDAAGHIMSQ